jgi:hypothetical protein
MLDTDHSVIAGAQDGDVFMVTVDEQVYTFYVINFAGVPWVTWDYTPICAVDQWPAGIPQRWLDAKYERVER